MYFYASKFTCFMVDYYRMKTDLPWRQLKHEGI